MSEANTPFNDQGLRYPADESDWDTSPSDAPIGEGADATASSETAQEPSPPLADDWHDWQTVDFPNAISADAIERQTLYADAVAKLKQSTQNSGDLIEQSTQLEGMDGDIPQPDIAELISLIQELNQCNNILLDRVSQLEDALERSQNALQELSQQPTQHETTDDHNDLAVAQQQVAQLLNQVEFATQANQRQQILIETLTAQLDSSQERVAQLEREAALTQQRYNEQSHLLAQTENASRDLHARLQRQQRYTLQFKAALEKCLEVPAPSYEPLPDAAASRPSESLQQSSPTNLQNPAFLPKAQRIQPWSSQFSVSAVDSSLSGFLSAPELMQSPSDMEAPPEADPARSTDPLSSHSGLKLPAIASPNAPNTNTADSPKRSQSFQIETASSEEPASTSLAASDRSQHHAHPDDVTAKMADSNNSSAQLHELSDLSELAALQGLELESLLNMVSGGAPADLGTEGAAEDALWQDLARLIDVSTDDVVKASFSESFSDFEATSAEDSHPLAQPGEPESAESLSTETTTETVEQSLSVSSNSESAPASANSAPPNPASQNSSGVFTTGASWPSPIVYPLRPVKKRSSLAAVDLPTFPRP